jgi:plastocyanin
MRGKRPRMVDIGVVAAFGGVVIGLAARLPVARAADAGIQGQVMARERPAANAVIWLEAPHAPKSPQRQRIVLDQRNLTFCPHVLAVRVGTTVDFPNNDRVFHNVFSFKNGKQFNLGLYPVGAMKKVTFDQPGLSRIFCSIHPEMAAYVLAVDTPYFAVSDSKGRFILPDVPVGSYTYHAWRPGGSELKGTAVICPGAVLEVRWP